MLSLACIAWGDFFEVVDPILCRLRSHEIQTFKRIHSFRDKARDCAVKKFVEWRMFLFYFQRLLLALVVKKLWQISIHAQGVCKTKSDLRHLSTSFQTPNFLQKLVRKILKITYGFRLAQEKTFVGWVFMAGQLNPRNISLSAMQTYKAHCNCTPEKQRSKAYKDSCYGWCLWGCTVTISTRAKMMFLEIGELLPVNQSSSVDGIDPAQLIEKSNEIAVFHNCRVKVPCFQALTALLSAASVFFRYLKCDAS